MHNGCNYSGNESNVSDDEKNERTADKKIRVARKTRASTKLRNRPKSENLSKIKPESWIEPQFSTSSRPELKRLMGSSAAIRALRDQILTYAEMTQDVLILGESGTGKEIAARALHELSNRSKHPFIAINCTEISETLIESELFGHVKGSFTGATTDKNGLFLDAGSGTMFIDEVGDMPETMQTKLLRVLQERQVRPVGSSQPKPMNARLIFATHRDLPAMMEAGKFRKDLYWRMNKLELYTPTLRERLEDVPLLARYFIEAVEPAFARGDRLIQKGVLELFSDYDWTANVRELENVIPKLIARIKGRTELTTDVVRIFLRDLKQGSLRGSVWIDDKAMKSPSYESFQRYLDRLELALIETMIACSTKRAEAAQRLVINYPYINTRLRELRLLCSEPEPPPEKEEEFHRRVITPPKGTAEYRHYYTKDTFLKQAGRGILLAAIHTLGSKCHAANRFRTTSRVMNRYLDHTG